MAVDPNTDGQGANGQVVDGEPISFGDLKATTARGGLLTLDGLAGETITAIAVNTSGEQRKRYSLTLSDGRQVAVTATVADVVRAGVEGRKRPVALRIARDTDGTLVIS